MATDRGPVVQSAILRGELVRLRKTTSLTQEDVARTLEWPPSKLIRIEGGRSSIASVDLDTLLSTYAVGDKSFRSYLQDLNRGTRSPAWWDDYGQQIARPYLKYVGYETGASAIRQFPGPVIPGLLQTEDYAKALTTASIDSMEVAPVVRLRMQRQAHLARRANPPVQDYVLDEAVVRRHIGIDRDPAIMITQLQYMVDRAVSDNKLTIRVIPFDAGEHAGLGGAFTLVEFEGQAPDLVYLDSGRGDQAAIRTDGTEFSIYSVIFTELIDRALSSDDSISFIEAAIEQMSLSGSTLTVRFVRSAVFPSPRSPIQSAS